MHSKRIGSIILNLSVLLMSRKREHGERNFELSELLHEGKKYYDWVVTTCFYAAIHFVEDVLLLCEINGSSCKTISDVKSAYKMQGRHSARERLVCEKMDLQTAVKYKWLDDKSRYSRYTTYKVTPTEADKAREYTRQIQNRCYDVNQT